MEINEKYAKQLDMLCARRKAHDFYRGLQPLMPAIRKLYRDNITIKAVRPRKTQFTMNDMEKIALAFYNQFDNELYIKLKAVLDDPYVIYEKNEPQAFERGISKNSCGKRMGRPHIELTPEDDVKGLFAPAHEFAHALSERIQKYVPQKTDCLGEIESKFIEKVFADFLLERDIISQEDYENLKNITKLDLAIDCELLLQENDILSQINTPITKEKLEKFIEDYSDNPNLEVLINRLDEMTFGDSLNRYGQYIFRYVVGEVFARALYEAYKFDPEEVKQNFKAFLRCNAEITLEEAGMLLLGDNYKEKIIEANDLGPQNQIS